MRGGVIRVTTARQPSYEDECEARLQRRHAAQLLHMEAEAEDQTVEATVKVNLPATETTAGREWNRPLRHHT
jgi:hypothetical protein